MQFEGECWHTANEESTIRICRDSAHPGLTGDIAWRWTSTVNGPVQVRISARKIDTAGGDGVTIHVYHGLQELESWFLEANNSQGITGELTVNLAQGDYLFFVMKMNQNPINDHTAFQAQIYEVNN